MADGGRAQGPAPTNNQGSLNSRKGEKFFAPTLSGYVDFLQQFNTSTVQQFNTSTPQQFNNLSVIPEISVQTPVLYRLDEVFHLYGFRSVEVGDGAAYFEDAVVGSRREVEAFHGVHQFVCAGFVELAEFSDEAGVHLGVCVDAFDIVVGKAFGLYFTRADDSFADLFRAFRFGR